MVWVTGPARSSIAVPRARLTSPDAAADSWSARAGSTSGEIASFSPSADTTSALRTPAVVRENSESSRPSWSTITARPPPRGRAGAPGSGGPARARRRRGPSHDSRPSPPGRPRRPPIRGRSGPRPGAPAHPDPPAPRRVLSVGRLRVDPPRTPAAGPGRRPRPRSPRCGRPPGWPGSATAPPRRAPPGSTRCPGCRPARGPDRAAPEPGWPAEPAGADRRERGPSAGPGRRGGRAAGGAGAGGAGAGGAGGPRRCRPPGAGSVGGAGEVEADPGAEVAAVAVGEVRGAGVGEPAGRAAAGAPVDPAEVAG